MASAVIFIFTNCFLNTLFVSVSYGTPFTAFFITKLLANTANFLIQLIVLSLTAKPLTDGIKKVVIWLLGLIMTIFIGVLSLQRSISVSTDSIALKAVRFAVSSSVPFVGGAVSDALATVKTSVQLIKSGIGSFGIIAGASILLPVLINTLIYKLFLFIGKTIGDIFGNESVTNMIKSGENVMSIILAIISCFFVFVTVSTALVLIICRG